MKIPHGVESPTEDLLHFLRFNFQKPNQVDEKKSPFLFLARAEIENTTRKFHYH
jgi:hypothetical protein